MSTIDRAERAPDVYFLPEYVRAASIAEHGEALHLEAHDGAWQMPLIVRSVSHGLVDAITPAFSGIYASPDLSPGEVQAAWEHCVEQLRVRGIVSLVVRGSPVVPQAPTVSGLRSISSGRPTIVLDLSDESAAWDSLKSNCRSRIRKAEKSGYSSEVRPAALPDIMPGGGFRDLYEATMDRIGADPLYHFGDSYYAELLAGLGADLLLAEVRDPNGVVASACLLMRHGQERLHYHLAGSRPLDARMGSNNLMMWSGIRFAVADGLSHFHVGAGVAGRQGVYRFKTTFGGREAPYDVSGIIIDDDRYQNLVRTRAEECEVGADDLLATGYFPAYRADPAPSP